VQSEYAIFIQKIEKITGGDTAPSSDPSPLPSERRTPPPALTPQHLQCLDPRAFGARPFSPPLQNPRYATASNTFG